jgi:hypothetical protein
MDDDDLMQLVARAVAADGPPEHLLDAARSSLSWASIDEELMALVEDSASQELALVRDATAERMLVFESADGIVDVSVVGHDPATIGGRLDEPAIVHIERPSGVSTTVADTPTDHFTATDLAPGSVRIVLDRDAGTTRSEWFTI